MTSLLEKALREAARPPAAEQDRIARVILDEIEDDGRWQASFARSQDRLAALAGAACEEIARGEVRDGASTSAGPAASLAETPEKGSSCLWVGVLAAAGFAADTLSSRRISAPNVTNGGSQCN